MNGASFFSMSRSEKYYGVLPFPPKRRRKERDREETAGNS